MRLAAPLVTLLVITPFTIAADLDHATAGSYFAEAKALAHRDGSKLWGVSLEGPMLFADRQTRRVVANQKDAEGQLQEEDGVFVGQLPPNVGIANMGVKWAGVHWTMVMWPLPKDKNDRGVLMMHESWHRVQDAIGLPATGPANHHLDTADGRLWLQLEWRALHDALLHEGDARRHAIADALAFRAHRRSLFKDAATEERQLEMHEGLAEYTGVKLGGMGEADQRLYAAHALEARPAAMPTFVRSFAYLSGPAYGLLLDGMGVEWRKGLKQEQDFGDLLRQALQLPAVTPTASEVGARSKEYSGDKLRQAEEEREAARQKRVVANRAKFVNGPVLELPLENARFSFDPNAAEPFEALGTVYPSIRLTDVWGILTVEKGVLMAADFKKATVVAPKDPKASLTQGPGWELELKAGWRVKPGKREGDFVLAKD